MILSQMPFGSPVAICTPILIYRLHLDPLGVRKVIQRSIAFGGTMLRRGSASYLWMLQGIVAILRFLFLPIGNTIFSLILSCRDWMGCVICSLTSVDMIAIRKTACAASLFDNFSVLIPVYFIFFLQFLRVRLSILSVFLLNLPQVCFSVLSLCKAAFFFMSRLILTTMYAFSFSIHRIVRIPITLFCVSVLALFFRICIWHELPLYQRPTSVGMDRMLGGKASQCCNTVRSKGRPD